MAGRSSSSTSEPRRSAMGERFNASTWLVDRHLDDGRGDHVAIECGADATSYRGILAEVHGAANGLRALGVRPEERVVLVMNDGVAFVAVFLGALRIGAIPVP